MGEMDGDAVGDMTRIQAREEKERMNPAEERERVVTFSGRSLELKVISWSWHALFLKSVHPASEWDGETRIVSFTSAYVLTVCTNVGHLLPSSANDDDDGGSCAGLDTVCTLSYSSRFRKLS